MSQESFLDKVSSGKKKRVDSKAKGKTFERKVAGMFSEWYLQRTGIPKGFMRAPLSGASFGGQNRANISKVSDNLKQPGDILTPEGFRFIIECKHYKKCPDIANIAAWNVLQWKTWWSQVAGDAKAAGKHPMLIIKYNDIVRPIVIFHSASKKDLGIISISYGPHLQIASLDNVLNSADSEQFLFGGRFDKSGKLC